MNNMNSIDLQELRALTDKLLEVQEVTDVKRKLLEIMIDTLPHFAMIIDKDRNILAANRVALESGAITGAKCWATFGKSLYITDEMKAKLTEKQKKLLMHEIRGGEIHCRHCMADEALATQKTQRRLVIAFDKFWDTYWVPLSDDVYYHYAMDVTDWVMGEYEE